ncbi:MAG: M10 family metallopeptidase C-terminal domain-containing protein [Acetobacteraceae bacterium]|nr:M10 family metallopeptidase C-terminal domain-containing protein [Acetobacteraceae bacterium]
MATATAHTPVANDVTRAVEGNQKWSTTTLSYAYAGAADAAFMTADLTAKGLAAFPYKVLDAGGSTDVFRNMTQWAMSQASRVANIDFTAAADFASADVKISGIQGLSYTGQADFPGTNAKVGGGDETVVVLLTHNADGTPYFAAALPGAAGESGFSRYIAMHEFGHAIGLGHPHDTGNGTTAIAAVAATSSDDPLDNDRYTVMSYEFGGSNASNFQAFGNAASYSALDIKALQDLYGSRAANTGASSYALRDAGGGGTLTGEAVAISRSFYTIWDTAGTDAMVYAGANRVVLNLNDATLDRTDDATTTEWLDILTSTPTYAALPDEIKKDLMLPSYHAGGFISRVFDISGNVQLGGYTIANGVTIENAAGGTGDDVIIGNEADNSLLGDAGNDMMMGAAGNDTINGDAGDDILVGGSGNDTLNGGEGQDLAIFSDICANYDITRDDSTGVITVKHVRGSGADGTDTLAGVEKALFKGSTVDLTATPLGCPPIDFIFLVDLSGSYSDDLSRFQAQAREMAAAVRSLDPESRFALASFVDRPVSPWGSTGDYLYKPELALTDSIPAFESALGGLTIFSGNDYPEAQFVGLWRAANGYGLNLRPDSQKIILLATDAPPHSASDYGLSEATISDFLAKEGIIGIASSATADATAAAPSDTTVSAGDGGLAKSDVETSVGYDVDPGNPDTRDVLTRLLDTLMASRGVQPIFAVTSSVTSTYSAFNTSFGRGTTVPIDSSSSDIADSLRLALAELYGDVTARGDNSDNILIGTPDRDRMYGLGGKDRIEGREENDTIDGGNGDDLLYGQEGDDLIEGGGGNDFIHGDLGLSGPSGDGNDTLRGGLGSDFIIGGGGNDTLDAGADGGAADYLFGGTGNDTYIVNGVTDLVYEGDLIAGFEGGAGDFDTIISTGEVFRDYYSVGEKLIIAEAANVDFPDGTYIIGGAGMAHTEIVGNSGANFILAYGGDNTIKSGGGDDSISLSLYDLDASANGVNTVVMQAGTGRDFIYDFESGIDKVDVSAFGLDAAGLFGTGVDVAAAGGNAAYCYFYLGETSGTFNYVAFVDRSTSQIAANDFIYTSAA